MSDPAKSAAASRFLAVLFAILLPLSTVAAWAVTTVTDTDRWVATLHPLASNEVVTKYIAVEGASTIVKQLNVESRIKKALPSGAEFLASPVTTEVESTIARALETALASEAFQSVWDRENRFTHSTAVAILDGRGDATIAQSRKLVINLTPSIVSAIDRLDEQGITFLDPIKNRLNHDKILVLHLLNAKEIKQAQAYYRLATTLEWILPFLTLLLALAVIFTSRPRRDGIRRLSLAVLVSSLVAYGLLKIGLALATPLAPTPTDVTRAILNAITRKLSLELLLLAAIGTTGLVINWLLGPRPRAVAFRHTAIVTFGSVISTMNSRSKDLVDTDWNEWSTQNRPSIEKWLGISNVAVGVFAVIALIWWIESFWAFTFCAVVVTSWYWFAVRLRRRLNEVVEIDATAQK